MLCSLFYSKQPGVTRGKREGRREEGSAEGDSTHSGGETDGLCMGYLQPVGEWGKLGTGSREREEHSRGSL